MKVIHWLSAGALLASVGTAPVVAQKTLVAPGPQGDLAGTLVAPAEGQPLVLIIPGSGPTDRDGNSPLGVTAAPYRLLADALAERGIGTLRIDKRGMFASKAVADAMRSRLPIMSPTLQAGLARRALRPGPSASGCWGIARAGSSRSPRHRTCRICAGSSSSLYRAARWPPCCANNCAPIPPMRPCWTKPRRPSRLWKPANASMSRRCIRRFRASLRPQCRAFSSI